VRVAMLACCVKMHCAYTAVELDVFDSVDVECSDPAGLSDLDTASTTCSSTGGRHGPAPKEPDNFNLLPEEALFDSQMLSSGPVGLLTLPRASLDSEAPSSARDSEGDAVESLDTFSARSEPGELPDLWTVVLRKEAGTSLGLTLDTLDGHSLLVTEILDGLVRRCNKAAADSSCHVKPGDSICAVGGRAGSNEELLKLLKVSCLDSEESIDMTLQRPRSFLVDIHRAYRPLGLHVEHTGVLNHGGGLLVQKIAPGLLRDWNVAQRSLAIKRNDRIVRVNGQRGYPEDLLKLIKAAAQLGQRLELEVLRYASWENVLRRLALMKNEMGCQSIASNVHASSDGPEPKRTLASAVHTTSF